MFYTQLIALCQKEGVKPTPLIKSLGFSAGNIKRWENGATVNSDILLAVAEHFKVSTDYLLTGKETNLQTDQISEDEQDLLKIYNSLSNINKAKVKERAEVFAEIESTKTNIDTFETRFIELSSASVSAGTGEPLFDDSYPDFIQIKINDNTKEANFAVKINGNSMKPYYEDEDIVLVKSQPEVAIGQIGIFIIDNEGFIKKRGADKLISLNPEYEDVYFKEGQEIWCKGLVVGILDEEDIIE